MGGQQERRARARRRRKTCRAAPGQVFSACGWLLIVALLLELQPPRSVPREFTRSSAAGMAKTTLQNAHVVGPMIQTRRLSRALSHSLSPSKTAGNIKTAFKISTRRHNTTKPHTLQASHAHTHKPRTQTHTVSFSRSKAQIGLKTKTAL